MKQKFVDAHMAAAEVYSQLSSAKRLQVGCVVVKNNTIIGIGYNGMPSGWDNNCEEETLDKIDTDSGEIRLGRLTTKPEVLHAETNAIAKLAKSTESGDGATMFITHAPCLECAKLIFQSGINSVYYRNAYRNNDGIEFLKKCSVNIKKC